MNAESICWVNTCYILSLIATNSNELSFDTFLINILSFISNGHSFQSTFTVITFNDCGSPIMWSILC